MQKAGRSASSVVKSSEYNRSIGRSPHTRTHTHTVSKHILDAWHHALKTTEVNVRPIVEFVEDLLSVLLDLRRVGGYKKGKKWEAHATEPS